MNVLVNILVSILVKLLTNEGFIELVVRKLQDLTEKPDNKVNEEYTTLAQESLTMRIIDNMEPDDGNITVPNERLNQIKAGRKKR